MVTGAVEAIGQSALDRVRGPSDWRWCRAAATLTWGVRKAP